MATETISITAANGKEERLKALYWENVSLRHEVEFLQLLNKERKLKAKRMGMEANYYRKLHRIERYKEIQRKAQLEQKKAQQEKEEEHGNAIPKS